MYSIVLMAHVFAALLIVGLVLVQQGKGASMGAAFGSGASQTVFGSRGSGSFLFKLTMGFVAIFFATSIVLNYIAMQANKAANAGYVPHVNQTQPVNNLPPIPQIPERPATSAG